MLVLFRAESEVFPEGLVLRELAKLERLQSSPDALLNQFMLNIDNNIGFAQYVIQHCEPGLAERMLLILEQLPGEYLSFILTAVDSERNTIGHRVAMSEHYLILEPLFLRCQDKLSVLGQERVKELQNALGQTMENLREKRNRSTSVSHSTLVRLPPISPVGNTDNTQALVPYEIGVPLQKSRKALRKKGLFSEAPVSSSFSDTQCRYHRVSRRNGMPIKLEPLPPYDEVDTMAVRIADNESLTFS